MRGGNGKRAAEVGEISGTAAFQVFKSSSPSRSDATICEGHVEDDGFIASTFLTDAIPRDLIRPGDGEVMFRIFWER